MLWTTVAIIVTVWVVVSVVVALVLGRMIYLRDHQRRGPRFSVSTRQREVAVNSDCPRTGD